MFVRAIGRATAWVLPLLAPALLVAQQAPPRLTLTRDLFISGIAQNLVPISWMTVAPDGRIAIAQAQDVSIRVFTGEGAPVVTIGRKGAGPGELASNFGPAGWLGDTLWVYDGGNSRISLYSPRGVFVRETHRPALRPTPTGVAADYLPRGVAGLYADGSFLLVAAQRVSAGSQPPYAALRVGQDSAIRRVIGKTDPVETVGGLILPLSEPRANLMAFSPDAGRLVVASAAVDGPNAGTVRVTQITAAGDTGFSRRYPVPLVPIPQREIDSVVAYYTTQINRPDTRAVFTAAARDYNPRAYPPVQAVVVGRDGAVWIRMRTVPQGVPWLELDATGAVIGSLVAPPNLSIMVADRTTIWGTETDQDDVQSIVRYRIAPAR